VVEGGWVEKGLAAVGLVAKGWEAEGSGWEAVAGLGWVAVEGLDWEDGAGSGLAVVVMGWEVVEGWDWVAEGAVLVIRNRLYCRCIDCQSLPSTRLAKRPSYPSLNCRRV